MADQNYDININVKETGADAATRKIKDLGDAANSTGSKGVSGLSSGIEGLKSKLSEFASGAVEGATSGLGRFSSLATGAAGVAVGLTAAVGAAIYQISEFGDRMALAADDATEFADKMGVTTARLELLKIVADENSGSVEGLTRVFDKLSKSMTKLDEDNEKTSQAFAKLGFTMEELKDKSPEEQAYALIKRFESLGRTAEATAGIITILGPAFRDQIPSIRALGENIDDLKDRQSKYAKEAPKELEEAGAKLEKANTNLSASWKTLGNEIAVYTAGMQTAVKNWAADLLADIGNVLSKLRNANAEAALISNDRRNQIRAEETKKVGIKGGTFEIEANVNKRIQQEILDIKAQQGDVDRENAKFARQSTEADQKRVVATKAGLQAAKDQEKADKDRAAAAKSAASAAAREQEAVAKLGAQAVLAQERANELFNSHSEEAKARFEIEHGNLQKITQAEKDRIIELAKQRDEKQRNLDQQKIDKTYLEQMVELEQKRTAAIRDAGDAAGRKIQDQGVKEKDKFSFELRTKGMSPLEKERTSAIDNINRDFKDGKQSVYDAAVKGRDPEDGSNVDAIKTEIDGLVAKQVEATRAINETYDARIAKQSDWLGGLKTGAKSYFDSVADINKQMEGFGERTFDKMGDALANFVTTGKLDFKDFARSVLADLAKIIAKQLLLNTLKAAIGGTGFGALFGFAKGGAFEGGVQKFASGGVVSTPTGFGMAGGKMGLMGEAGPEAIMPLKRGPNGKLGVAVTGGGGSGGVQIGSISINVQGGNTNEETGAAMEKRLLETMKKVADGRIQNARRPGGLSYGV